MTLQQIIIALEKQKQNGLRPDTDVIVGFFTINPANGNESFVRYNIQDIDTVNVAPGIQEVHLFVDFDRSVRLE